MAHYESAVLPNQKVAYSVQALNAGGWREIDYATDEKYAHSLLWEYITDGKAVPLRVVRVTTRCELIREITPVEALGRPDE